MSKPDHHENVTRALSDMATRKRAESEKLERLMGDAERQKDFFRRMGEAVLEPSEPHDITATWTFPVGDIHFLHNSESTITGKGLKVTKASTFAKLFGPPASDTTEEFSFEAYAEGRVLNFVLKVKKTVTGDPYPTTSVSSGFLVISSDATRGWAMTNKPSRELFEVTRKQDIPVLLPALEP